MKQPKLDLKQLGQHMKPGITMKEVKKLLCGKLLGKGIHRSVYAYKHDPNFVVKIERDPSAGAFANVMEWRNYIDNRYYPWLAKWLTPCEVINETGQVLIQRKVNWDQKKKKDYPKKIPAVFTDNKYQNFGWIGDQFVCCDYAYLDMSRTGKMKTSKWWGPL